MARPSRVNQLSYSQLMELEDETENDLSFENRSHEFTAKKAWKGKKGKTEQSPDAKKENEHKTDKHPKTSWSQSTTATSKPVSRQRKLPATPMLPRPFPLRPAGGRLLKWDSPEQSDRSPVSFPDSTMKSPGQRLRLGLSRLSKVKPLHLTTSTGN
ncbi:hypothetical protein UPYG_G00268050 [Umbra pygmaea]|uniref:RAD51 interacting motif domain-containing protein n=1 Tax=Umbra pygmaea TaxID=75934 RepID=A0ABD0WF04_UMBPY